MSECGDTTRVYQALELSAPSYIARSGAPVGLAFGIPHAHFTSEGLSMNNIFVVLCMILFVAWILGLTAFHVVGGFIHILLILAIVSLVLHFFRGRSAV